MRSIGALADTISTGTEAMSGATNGVGTRAKSTSKGTDTFSGAARAGCSTARMTSAAERFNLGLAARGIGWEVDFHPD